MAKKEKKRKKGGSLGCGTSTEAYWTKILKNSSSAHRTRKQHQQKAKPLASPPSSRVQGGWRHVMSCLPTPWVRCCAVAIFFPTCISMSVDRFVLSFPLPPCPSPSFLPVFFLPFFPRFFLSLSLSLSFLPVSSFSISFFLSSSSPHVLSLSSLSRRSRARNAGWHAAASGANLQVGR